VEKELRLFENLTPDKLRSILIFGELTWLMVAGLAYYFYRDFFGVYAPIILVFNVLTLLPFPNIMRKASGDYNEEVLHYSGASDSDEGDLDSDKLGVWERACVGFYCVTNAILILFVAYWML